MVKLWRESQPISEEGPMRHVTVIVLAGGKSKTTLILGLPEQGSPYRLYTPQGALTIPSKEGILLTRVLQASMAPLRSLSSSGSLQKGMPSASSLSVSPLNPATSGVSRALTAPRLEGE